MLQFDRVKTGFIVAICLLGVLFASPNLFPRSTVESNDWPGFLPNRQINLGLDLQGGVHILFEVGMDEVVHDKLLTMRDNIRDALFGRDIEGGRIAYAGLELTGDKVSVRITDPEKMDAAVKRISDLSAPITSGTIGVTTPEFEIKRPGGSLLHVNLSEPAIEELENSAVARSIEVVRRRIDEMGTKEPTIQREGADRIVVQVPGVDDPTRIIELVRAAGKMNFHDVDTRVTVDEALSGRVPPGAILVPFADNEAQKMLLVERPIISGDRLESARLGFDQNGQPAVDFQFDFAGGKKFADHTAANVRRLFAIVLDGKIITAPEIQSAILGGNGQITGNFTVESANDLAIKIASGALPAPLEPLTQRTVGPDLGSDSIAAGQRASIIGFFGVIALIVLCYSWFGVFANIALILNLILVVGVLSLFGATLTLPGIAGIVLTIGMAVDANVLIFERIREELRSGKSPINAVDTGYSKAFGAIRDANLTTLFAALVLFYLGAGPIRGFAVTLAVGIFTSVFTAFVVTRLMIATWLRGQRRTSLPI